MIRKNTKKYYYQNKIKLFGNDIQNTQKIMKEEIVKEKCNNVTLHKLLIVD